MIGWRGDRQPTHPLRHRDVNFFQLPAKFQPSRFFAAKHQIRFLSTGEPVNCSKTSYFSKHICWIQFDAKLTEHIRILSTRLRNRFWLLKTKRDFFFQRANLLIICKHHTFQNVFVWFNLTENWRSIFEFCE